MRKGWKIIQVTALVRNEDEPEVHDGLAKMVEFDASLSAYVETRELTAFDEQNFRSVIEDHEANDAEDE